jgi:hypothetical protein
MQNNSQVIFLGDAETTPQSSAAVRKAFQAACAAASARQPGHATSIKAFQDAVDRRLDAQFTGMRADGVASTGGTLGAGALRAVLTPILEETRPVPNGFAMFAQDATSVRLGQNEVSATRQFFRGEVKVWGGAAGNMPSTNRAQTTRIWKVRYYITQIMTDVFEEMTENVANTGRWAQITAGMIAIMEEFANQKIWYGDDENQLCGVLNYPWFTRISLNGPSGKVWSTNEDLSGTSTDGYVRELIRFVTHSWTVSKTAFRPNRMLIGVKLMNFLKATPWKGGTTTVGDNPKSLLQTFLERNAIITQESQIEVAWELDDAFDAANGISCVILDRKDPMVIANLIPGGGPQMLPLVEEGYVKYQPLFMAHGGIVSLTSGVVTIGYIETGT